MKEVKKEDIKKVLREGKIIFLKGSNIKDKRLYRLTGNVLEYTDNNKDWKPSNVILNELENKEWILFEK